VAFKEVAMNGQVVHFELPADDRDRAKTFYAAAFGWDLVDVPTMSYTMVTTTPTGDRGPIEPGAINGGMAGRGSPITAPVITIDVDDIDEALGTVERLGGKIVQGRAAVGDMGFTGYFADTEGNVVGLWQTAR
jgi:predicted enzyme related to lactoylglutathione lyase